MILADILQWFLIILGAFLTLNAHWMGAYALFPGVVARARDQYDQRPVRATLVGLLIVVPIALIAVVLAKALPHPLVQMATIGLMLVLILIALLGAAGLVERIGHGLPSPSDVAQPWRRMLRGGTVLGLVFLLPILGWTLFFWTLISGVGAWALAGRAPQAAASATVITVIAPAKP